MQFILNVIIALTTLPILNSLKLLYQKSQVFTSGIAAMAIPDFDSYHVSCRRLYLLILNEISSYYILIE